MKLSSILLLTFNSAKGRIKIAHFYSGEEGKLTTPTQLEVLDGSNVALLKVATSQYCEAAILDLIPF